MNTGSARRSVEGGDKRICGNNRKRRREEIIVGAHNVPPSQLLMSASVSAAALLSCLVVASALTHVPARPSALQHAFCTRTRVLSSKDTVRRARHAQLNVGTTSRSSISLDEIPTCLERMNKRSQNWSIRYSDLVEYKRKYGHTNVPLSYSDTKLAIWVRNQRHQFRHLLNRRRSTMTRDRYEKLCAIDFDFGTPSREAWDRRYQELISFKERHGHCNVPHLWSENLALSRWVTCQRICHRNLQSGIKPDISTDRVQALEDIGFEWTVNDKKWQGMLERTQRTLFFVGEGIGNDVENTEEETFERRPDWTKILGQHHNRDVRVWIDVQRYQYARLQRNEPSSLTPERINKIERSIPGFQWIGSRGPRQKTAEETQLEEDWAKIVEEAKKVDIEAVVVADKDEEDDLADWGDADLMDLWAMEDD